MMNRIKKWFEIGREFMSSLLFPPRCPVCDEILAPEEVEKGIHLACESKLYPVKGAVCMHCGRPLGHINSQKKEKQYEMSKEIPLYLKSESIQEYCRECQAKGYISSLCYDNTWNTGIHKKYAGKRAFGKSNITQAKSLYLYKGAIKKSMYRFKYANKREYAYFFARQAVEKYGSWLGVTPNKNALSVKDGIEVIVPVPMYLPKQRQRGYNQAEVFAEALSKLTGIPVDKSCVCRIKDTTPQKELNHIARKNNLENAFQRGKNIVQYRHILVVDDIYTTGYTAEMVAGELRKQGDCQIYLLSICIGGND